MENKENNKLLKADLISSIVVFAFGLYVLISGIYISFFAETGTDVWYYSPGFFPGFIGIVLMILSAIMFFQKRKCGAILAKNEDKTSEEEENTSKIIVKLIIAVALLIVYVFFLIGRLPFIVSTFLYLSVTMIAFRKNNYAIWKILLISALTSLIIYLFFGVIASIPLP